MVLLALAISVAAACNGTELVWVAELSDADPARTSSLAVTIPIGSHVTVVVHNAGWINPSEADGILLKIKTLWHEHRTVFRGMSNERDVAIPFFLFDELDYPSSGIWAIEIEPTRVGKHRLVIDCGREKAFVRVDCVDIPRSEIGYGLYVIPHRLCEPILELDYMKDMVRHGMNTFTARSCPVHFVPGNYPGKQDKVESFRLRMEAALKCGLANENIPVVLLHAPNEDIVDEIKRHDDWPEFYGYSVDEPQVNRVTLVAQRANGWRDLGIKSITSIAGESADQFGHLLDAWILFSQDDTKERFQRAENLGVDRFSYLACTRGTNAPLHRYWYGLYSWAIGTRASFTWAYMHLPEYRIKRDGSWNLLKTYGMSIANRHGDPVPTVALKGLSDGVIDSRFLQELERRNTPEGNAYLAELRSSVRLGFWPDGKTRKAGPYVWDVPDTAIPPVDLVKMRARLVEFLEITQ